MKMQYWMLVLMVFTSLVAFGILFHQFLVCGHFFELKDALHHEVFAVGLLSFNVALLVAWAGRTKHA